MVLTPMAVIDHDIFDRFWGKCAAENDSNPGLDQLWLLFRVLFVLELHLSRNK